MQNTTVLTIASIARVFKGLEEGFVGEKPNTDAFVWKEISTVLKDARAGEITKSCMSNIIKNGKQESE